MLSHNSLTGMLFNNHVFSTRNLMFSYTFDLLVPVLSCTLSATQTCCHQYTPYYKGYHKIPLQLCNFQKLSYITRSAECVISFNTSYSYLSFIHTVYPPHHPTVPLHFQVVFFFLPLVENLKQILHSFVIEPKKMKIQAAEEKCSPKIEIGRTNFVQQNVGQFCATKM